MFHNNQAYAIALPSHKNNPRLRHRLATLLAVAAIALSATPLLAHWEILDHFPQRPAHGPRPNNNNNNNNNPPTPRPIQVQTPVPDPDPTPAAPVLSPEEIVKQKHHADAMALDTLGCDAFDKRDWAAAAKAFEQAIDSEPNDQILHNNLAITEHWEAAEAAQKGDLATAIRFYQMALANNPADSAALKSQLAAAQKELQDQKDAKVLSGTIQQNLRVFAQTLEPLPPMAQPLVVPGGDASIVDTRNNSFDLPKDVEHAIQGAYPNASPEVTGRLYKGFQQVNKNDWHAAMGWFKDALYQDPNNPTLKAFVEEAQTALDRNEKATTLHPVQIGDLVPPPREAYAPSKTELENFLMLLSLPKSRTLPPSTNSPPRD